MKKNGFTLVELMGVIAVMAVLIVVVATNGFGVFNKAKSGIDKLEEDNLLESARVFLVDVDNGLCPTSMTDAECTAKRNDCVDTDGCTIDVQFLEDNTYFNDKGNRCDGTQFLNLKIEEVNDNINDYVAEKQSDTQVICKNS